MFTFPLLKTNAVMQYPAIKTVQFRNQALRFVDGTEQRYRDSASALHSWTIRLTELDEGEMAAIETFFAETQGQSGTFSFTDPWDGRVYNNCSIQSGELGLESTAEMRAGTALTIIEDRN
jgi:hypothetical protein